MHLFDEKEIVDVMMAYTTSKHSKRKERSNGCKEHRG